MTVDSGITWSVQVVEANTLIVRPAKRGRIQSGTMVARNLRSESGIYSRWNVWLANLDGKNVICKVGSRVG